MHVRNVRFASTPVAVRSDGSTLDGAVARILASYGIREEPAPTASEVQIRMRVGIEGAPASEPGADEPGAELGWTSGGVRVHRAGPTLSFRNDDFVFRVNASNNEAEGWVSHRVLNSGTLPRELQPFLFASLVVLLRQHRLYPLHAAALVHRDRGLLLVADSDSGKSTLSFSLVRRGWQYLSDDAVFLDAKGETLAAVPYRRRFGLDAGAERVFPELGGRTHESQLAEAEKWAVSVDEVYPGQAAERCVPHVLVFPQVVDAEESRLVEVGRVDALYEVVRQSALLTIDPAMGEEHLDALQRLVSHTCHYRLLSGRDLLREPGRADDLLSALLMSA